MKVCPEWKDAIAECALGQVREPEMAAHLAVCPECGNALRESQAIAAWIDRALKRSAAVEPPLYGPERVMARVGRQKDARWLWRWAAAGSVVAVTLIAIVMWMPRRPAPDGSTAALSAWRSPTQALLRPPVAAAWSTTPRLGEGFFKIKPSGETHAQ
jgi:hypothetical protein